MIRPAASMLALAALGVALGCERSDPLAPAATNGPRFQTVPADGNGNKNVTPVDFQLPAFTSCPSGATLDLHVVGWIQDRPGGDPANQPGVLTYAFKFIYSNAAGATYTWVQVGSNIFRLDANGNFIIEVMGRQGYAGNVGRFVINGATGELVSISGHGVFAEDLACAAIG